MLFVVLPICNALPYYVCFTDDASLSNLERIWPYF